MEFDDFVGTLTNEHALFVSALKGVFMKAAFAGHITPAELSKVKIAAYNIGATHLSRVTSQIDSYAQEMTVDGTEELETAVTARQIKALESIRFSVIASIKEVTTSARALALGGSMSPKAIAEIGDKVKAPDGRKWQAEKLFRVVVRDFAYQTMVDRAIDAVMKTGGTNVTITYDVSADREYENVTMALGEFASLRPKIFHINATAKV